MQTGTFLNVLLTLSQWWLISKLGNYIHPSLAFSTRATMASRLSTTKVFTHFIVPVDHKLFIKWWIVPGCLLKLHQSFLLLVHSFHQEEGKLYFQCCTSREFLNRNFVHVFCMLKKQLMVVLILNTFWMLLCIFLILCAVHLILFVLFELAVCIGAGVLMMIDVSL